MIFGLSSWLGGLKIALTKKQFPNKDDFYRLLCAKCNLIFPSKHTKKYGKRTPSYIQSEHLNFNYLFLNHVTGTQFKLSPNPPPGLNAFHLQKEIRTCKLQGCTKDTVYERRQLDIAALAATPLEERNEKLKKVGEPALGDNLHSVLPKESEYWKVRINILRCVCQWEGILPSK